MTATLLCTALACFLLAYTYLGRHLERLFDLHLPRAAPANNRKETSRDYNPAPKSIVFGHHFASIAGAAPIIGPIVACASFGWLPTILWIIFGSILMGGVHDFSALAISLNSDGRSIGFTAQTLLGKPIGKLFSVFILLAMIYVLIVFLDLTASSFLPLSKAAVDDGQRQVALQGGIVASSSLCLIVSAVLFGLLEKTAFRRHAISNTLTALFFLSISLWLAHLMPITTDTVPFLSHNFWIVCLVAYAWIASVLPVKRLLQPRDFISAFLLYFCMIVGLAGAFVSSVTHAYPLNQPAFLTWRHSELGSIFPALFITVSCGACSGFHSIVSSGSTSKQIANMEDAKLVGYGAMLTEGLLALIAAITFVILPMATPMQTMSPPQIFSHGLGLLATTLGLPIALGRLLGFLAISTFLLTTLDTATRLSRYILAEILPRRYDRYLGSPLMQSALCLAPVLFLSTRDYITADGSAIPLWRAMWSLFGATNQLLGALALCIAVLWLKTNGKRSWLISLAALCLSAVTFLGLFNAISSKQGSIKYIGVAILAVAVVVTTRTLIQLASLSRKKS